MTRLQLTATAPVRLLTRAFLLIAEPRVIRALQFLIYGVLGVTGACMFMAPPANFVHAMTGPLVAMFSLFVVVGSAFGLVAVLPGIWWLERAGILALGTGLLIYGALGAALGSSIFVAGLTAVFAVTLVQRWTQIRGADLAPKKLLPADVGV